MNQSWIVIVDTYVSRWHSFSHKDFFRRIEKKGVKHRLEMGQGHVLLQRQPPSLKNATVVFSIHVVGADKCPSFLSLWTADLYCE